ncbi:hypothetical protein ABPG72_002931 [Tetrahymena utriculariae]
MKQLHVCRESKSLKTSYFMSNYQDFENQDSSFELDEKSYKKQPTQPKYPNSHCMNQENQKLTGSSGVLENKNKQKRQKNKKLTFKIDLNKIKNPYSKQALKGKNKNKSIFDDPEFSGIANTDISLYALHKQGVIDEENNQWGKLQKQLDEINPKPDINKVLDSLVSQKFSRPFQEFKIQKHLALPEFNQSEVSSRYRQNQTCEIFDEDPEIDKYIEETKQQIQQKKKQIEDNLKSQKSNDPITNQPHQNRPNNDCSFSSELQENQFEKAVKSKIPNKKNEYILSEEEHKELFLLYCAKGHSPESACQQARVPIKCAKRWICNLTPSRLTGGGRKIIDGMLEQKLRLWILLKLYKELKIPSRDQQIKYSLSQIKQNSFGCSKGWLEKYLDRNLLKFIVAHLRNLEIFRLEEVAKFFIVIPSVNLDLGQVQKEIKLVQSYQKHLELEQSKQQNKDGEQSNYVTGTKAKWEDLIIQPFISDDQNYFFNKLLQSIKDKNNQILESKHPQNKEPLSKTVNYGNSQQKPLMNQFPLFNDKIAQNEYYQYQIKSQANNQQLHFQTPDLSPYLQMIERANAMKQLQYYLTENKNSKKLEIEDNQLLSIKAQMIEKLKQNTQISQETLAKFGNLYKFQEVQKLQEAQKLKQEKQQTSQMQIEKAQVDQEVNKKNDLKQTKLKLKKINIENEEEEEEEEEDEDFQTKCKNEQQTKFDEREFYVDTKKPLPLHIRKLLKLSAINSRSDRLSQQPKNLDYYLKDCVFEIEAQNFFDVAVKTLNYKIEYLIQVFKFRF